MNSKSATPTTVVSKRVRVVRRLLVGFGCLLGLYLVVAYIVAPSLWKHYADRHPAFDDNPRITQTGDGHPGDPLNVALVGTEADIYKIMKAAKWYVADPLGLKSDLEIAAGTVLERSYDKAPVSSLYLFGRKEDFAFEQAAGNDPSKRNHVRFWHTAKTETDGRPVWIGAATYDERVGFSHTTGQITHHTAPDIDSERDHLFADLENTGELSQRYEVLDFHKILDGRNGGGDPWHTDGTLQVGVIGTK